MGVIGADRPRVPLRARHEWPRNDLRGRSDIASPSHRDSSRERCARPTPLCRQAARNTLAAPPRAHARACRRMTSAGIPIPITKLLITKTRSADLRRVRRSGLSRQQRFAPQVGGLEHFLDRFARLQIRAQLSQHGRSARRARIRSRRRWSRRLPSRCPRGSTRDASCPAGRGR